MVHTGAMYKCVVYIPTAAKEAVKEALFAAGAGSQGAYLRCAWECPGVGQFMPVAGATPAIGELDQLERVEEWRVEVLLSGAVWPQVKTALLATHPYESPAYELIELAASGASD